MKQGDVTISIEELVLDGFAPGDRHRIAAAVSAELTRLVAERGLPEGLVQGAGGAPSMAVSMRPEGGPDRAGAEVARAIYRGWESAGAAGRGTRSGGGRQ